MLEDKQHRLVLEVDENLVVRVDPLRMTQVLSNLLINAVRYTDPGGHIVVRGHCSAGHAVIAVEDNGRGIRPELLERMFEPFAQGAGPSRKGLGLGLALVKQIVELHGGRAIAHSSGEGQGTTFVVRLPLADKRTAKGCARSTSGRRWGWRRAAA
jgi:signal transduction histidine kinase